MDPTIKQLPFPTSHDQRHGGPKGAKSGAPQKPGDAKGGKPAEPKIEQPQDQKSTSDTANVDKAHGEEGAAAAGELQSRQGPIRQGKGDNQTSGFREGENFHTLTQLPEQFGHKFPLPQQGPMVHKDRNALPGFGHDNNMPQRQGNALQPQRPRLSPESYKAVVGDRVFKGPMRNTPLHQKLQQQATTSSDPAATTSAATRIAEPLTKGEVLQMFRMRNQADNKERFRDVLKNELARAREAMASKVQAAKYETDSQHHKEIHEQVEISAHTLDAKRAQLASKLDSGKELSRFEEVLQDLLGGKKTVPDLPADVRARFAAKSGEEWNAFFKSVLKQSAELTAEQAKTKNLIEALYRGTYIDQASGEQRLVADLAFTLDGEVIENKYAQLTIKDEQLLAELAKLTPGDTLSQNILEKMGAELNFLKLAHIVALANISEEQKQQFLKSLKQSHNTKSQGDLEKALIARRGDDEKSKNSDVPIFPLPQQISPQRFTGNQKIYMYLFYAICAFAGIMSLWIILRSVL